MKQPLASVALVYAAGLVAGYYVPLPITAGLALCFTLLIGSCCNALARPWLLVAALFFSGWTHVRVEVSPVSPHDIRWIAGENALLIKARGRLADTPRQRVFVRDEEESWRTVAEFDLEAVQRRDGEWQPARGRVLTLTSGIFDRGFVLGQPAEVRGLLVRPQPPLAPGLFDFRRYLATKGMHYQLKVRSEDQWTMIGEAARKPVSARFCEWGQRTLAIGVPEDESLRLQWAMLLGWQTTLTNEVAEPFMRSGTLHIFAISGLHIAMIALILIALLRAVNVPRFACGCVVLPVIWFYTAATGWQASAVRSTVMSSVIILGWMFRRPSDLLNSLCAAALIILLVEPLQLFQASFQLSFFVVLSLALLIPWFDKVKTWMLALVEQRLNFPDPLVPMELRPAWQIAGMRLGNWAWSFFAVSLASFIGSLPLTAYYFNLFTPGSLLANLVVVPMSAAALVAGLASLVTGAMAPAVAEIFNHAGWFFMRGMVWLSVASAELPGSCFHVRSPSLPQFMLYYLVIIAGLSGWFLRARLRWLVSSFAAVLLIVCAIQWQMARGVAEMIILPLPGAHMVLAREANDSARNVVNCGHGTSFDLFVKPFLQGQGVNRLEHLVLARTDTRHNGAVLDLHGRFPISTAHVAPQKPLSAAFRDDISELEKLTVLRGDATNGAGIGPFHVVHPAGTDKFKRGQEQAAVLLGTFEGVRVLLLSGLGAAGQNVLFDRFDGQADIIVTEMPDYGEPLAPELIERVNPKLIVFVDTPRAPYPARLRQRLASTGVPILFTRETGAITLKMRNGAWLIESALSPPAPAPVAKPQGEPET